MDILIKDYHDNRMRELQRTAAAERLAGEFIEEGRGRFRSRLRDARHPTRSRGRNPRPSRSRHAVQM